MLLTYANLCVLVFDFMFQVGFLLDLGLQEA